MGDNVAATVGWVVADGIVGVATSSTSPLEAAAVDIKSIRSIDSSIFVNAGELKGSPPAEFNLPWLSSTFRFYRLLRSTQIYAENYTTYVYRIRLTVLYLKL